MQKSPYLDIKKPDLKVVDSHLNIRLIINTDGALVCNSPPYSAWPVFTAIADLPPRKRQMFKNITLASLYVGTAHPNFDYVWSSIQTELSVTEKVSIKDEVFKIDFKTILFVTDLIAKAKVLKMKQHNGYYGCTMCKKRGCHTTGAHFYPHDVQCEELTLSYESHHVNLKALENESMEELRAENAGDCEILTQGVNGFSKIFDLIAH